MPSTSKCLAFGTRPLNSFFKKSAFFRIASSSLLRECAPSADSARRKAATSGLWFLALMVGKVEGVHSKVPLAKRGSSFGQAPEEGSRRNFAK